VRALGLKVRALGLKVWAPWLKVRALGQRTEAALARSGFGPAAA
jgi:hypothetical protein